MIEMKISNIPTRNDMLDHFSSSFSYLSENNGVKKIRIDNIDDWYFNKISAYTTTTTKSKNIVVEYYLF